MKVKDDWGLEEYLGAPYEIRVRPKGGGKFLFYIPELGLQLTGESLDAAIPILTRQKEEHLRKFAEADLLCWVSRPGQTPSAAGPTKPSLARALLPFAIKSAVVTLLFLGAANAIDKGLNNLGRGLEKNFEGISKWSPEKVELTRDRAALVAQKLGPTIRELMGMFDRSVSEEPTPATVRVKGEALPAPKP